MFPFSLHEVMQLPSVQKSPFYMQATDGVLLAVYPFFPKHRAITAVVVFYHGSGLYTNNTYQWIGFELSQRSSIAFYGVDIRGHGFSGGKRGDAPSAQQVWSDIKSVVEHIKSVHPDVPIFLSGHSSGAGMLLNYANYCNDDAIDGYIFIAPYLGINSGVNKNLPGTPQAFVRSVRPWAFRLFGMTRGAIGGHVKAVFFNYPYELLHADPRIIDFRTVIMGRALDPWQPQTMMSALKKPLALFVAQNDEQFDADKLLAYKQYLPHCLLAQIVPNVGHISILVKTAALIEKAIDAFDKETMRP